MPRRMEFSPAQAKLMALLRLLGEKYIQDPTRLIRAAVELEASHDPTTLETGRKLNQIALELITEGAEPPTGLRGRGRRPKDMETKVLTMLRKDDIRLIHRLFLAMSDADHVYERGVKYQPLTESDAAWVVLEELREKARLPAKTEDVEKRVARAVSLKEGGSEAERALSPLEWAALVYLSIWGKPNRPEDARKLARTLQPHRQ